MNDTIGVYSPFLGGTREMGEVLVGVQDYAEEHALQVLVIPGGPATFAQHPIARDLVSGWIVVHHTDEIERLTAAGRPIVIVNGDSPAISCPIILPDNVGGTAAAVEHLIAHGHTRIAFTGNLHHRDVRDRLEGYRLAHQRRAVPVDPALIIDLGSDNEQVLRATVRRWLREGLPCSAAFAVNDHNALLIADLLEQAGVELPGALALAGFDDLDRGQYVVNRLTTVRQDFREGGRQAAALLHRAIAGSPPAPGDYTVPASLIIRESCGCARQSDRPAGAALAPGLAGRLRAALQPALAQLPQARHGDLERAVGQLTEMIGALLGGAGASAAQAHRGVWAELAALVDDLAVLHTLIDVCEDAALELAGDDRAAQRRLRSWVRQSRLDLARERHTIQQLRSDLIARASQITFQASVDMLTIRHSADLLDLAWLARTSEQAACLALWDADQRQLEVVGSFSATRSPLPISQAMPPERFPPLAALIAAHRQPRFLVKLLPIRSQGHDWGVLALYGPAEERMYSDTIAILLASSLERFDLVHSLERQRAELRDAYEREHGLVTELAATVDVLRTTQSQLVYAEKMVALGHLVAGVAHELRNPLNFVNNFALLSEGLLGELEELLIRAAPQLCAADISSSAELLALLRRNSREIVRNGQRADSVITMMLLHARGESGARAISNLNQLVDQALWLSYYSAMARWPALQSIVVGAQLAPDIPLLALAPQRLSQALINLVDNACYALAERAAREPGFTPELSVGTAIVDGWVEIHVRDNGPGIPPELLPKLFEPFVTSKPPGEGTGLGLSLVYDIIVHGHGGSVGVASELDRETVFTLRLPLSLAQAQ